MTKIDIISGFLGAGKTTLIKKLLNEAFQGEKLVLIENEFGEIGIDSGFLKEAGVQITEMNSGCICCSLVGDFGIALQEVLEKYSPDRVIIEPSGVGKLSDVIKAVQGVVAKVSVELNSSTAVVDVKKCKMYMKNFGEFFNNQIENAQTIILSRSQDTDIERLEMVVKELREHNSQAVIITTPWSEINGKQILETIEKKDLLSEEMLKQEQICPSCGHAHNDAHCHGDHGDDHAHNDACCHSGHDEDHAHNDACCHGGHDEDHAHNDACCHSGHDDGHAHNDAHCHSDDHHCHDNHDDNHDHTSECGCGHSHEGHEDHDHHHHADEVFTSWGKETPHKYSRNDLEVILKELSENDKYGIILRAKGMLPSSEGEWFHFDLVPGEYEIRNGAADVTGRLCVIGSQLKENELSHLFQLD